MPSGAKPGELRGWKPGDPWRGKSRKGIPNKRTVEVMERLAELGCDPIEGMARIAQDVTPCKVCHEGVLENGKTCPQCLGTGKLQASAELRGRMYAELAQYVAPKRKAVDLTVEGGDPVRMKLIEEAAAAILGMPIERGFATSQPLLPGGTSGGILEDD